MIKEADQEARERRLREQKYLERDIPRKARRPMGRDAQDRKDAEEAKKAHQNPRSDRR